MRIIAIGIGGAGCRIVNSLYALDRKSSKVACVQALAIDVDEATIKQCTALPENSRMCFTSLDAGLPDIPPEEQRAAPIDINEIVSRVQNMEYGENDAIFFCCGLGGSMVDVAPHIIAALRSSVVEPIFGLVTLPCLAEGERISGKAANDIEILSSMLDGIIVFDNETWHKKIKSQRATLGKKEAGFAEKIGLVRSEKPLPPAQATYRNLNEGIVRRISLILRAGEFKADGGIDLAEVVLDSGEVLNTMKGMGFITIGYAVEKLPHDPLRFLSWLKPGGLSDEEQKKRASRIVELAKQAIYHEISTPCDLTSAHKALVLIAGPSQELSMKGFMTVRKWIDRSIAGLETRSGDYPVMNTKNVAIIVMLSGLENIPRITELMEIRSQAKSRIPAGTDKPEREELLDVKKAERDEMITVPGKMSRDDDALPRSRSREDPALPATPPPLAEESIPYPEEPAGEVVRAQPPVLPEEPRPVPPARPSVPVPVPVSQPVPERESGGLPEALAPSRRRVIVARSESDQSRHIPHDILPSHSVTRDRHRTGSDRAPGQIPPIRLSEEEVPRGKETERQRIERELRRQRTLAMGGQPQKPPSHPAKSHPAAGEEKRVVRPRPFPDLTVTENTISPAGKEAPGMQGEQRKVIIGKRKVVADPMEEAVPSSVREKTVPEETEEPASESETDGMSVGIREHPYRARDAIFGGKGVTRSTIPPVRDSTLLHTDLRTRKKAVDHEPAGISGEQGSSSPAEKDHPSRKKRIKTDE